MKYMDNYAHARRKSSDQSKRQSGICPNASIAICKTLAKNLCVTGAGLAFCNVDWSCAS